MIPFFIYSYAVFLFLFVFYLFFNDALTTIFIHGIVVVEVPISLFHFLSFLFFLNILLLLLLLFYSCVTLLNFVCIFSSVSLCFLSGSLYFKEYLPVCVSFC